MNVRLEYPAEFLSGVYWNDAVLLNRYTVRCEMVTGTKNNVEQNIALERLKYTLFHQMQNSVFISEKEKSSIKRLEAAGIRAIPLPEQPVDQIIGMMLYCKLDAVMEGRIVMSQLRISSELGENIWYSQNETESVGPFGNKGWWNNPEPVCSDSRPNGKVVSINQTTTWQALDLHWTVGNQEKENIVLPFRKDDKE